MPSRGKPDTSAPLEVATLAKRARCRSGEGRSGFCFNSPASNRRRASVPCPDRQVGAVSFQVVKTTGWLRALLDRGTRDRPEKSPDAERFAPECMSLLELARLLAGPRYSERVASAYVEVV